jgi:hypothetical protein
MVDNMIKETKFNIDFYRIIAGVASEAYNIKRKVVLTSGLIEAFYNPGLSSNLLAVYSGFYMGENVYFLGIPGTNIKGSSFQKNILVDLAQDLLVATGNTNLPIANKTFELIQDLIKTGKKCFMGGHSLGGSILYQMSGKYNFKNVFYFAFNMGASPLTVKKPVKNFNSMVINGDIIAITSPIINYKFNPVMEYSAHSMNQFIKIFNDYS